MKNKTGVSSIMINYDSKKITIKNNKTNVWLLSLEAVIYIIVFFSLMFFVIYKSHSSLLSKVTVVTISSVIFLFVVFTDKKRFLDREFTIEFLDKEIMINNVVQAETKKIERIIIKESISGYSARAYYDIYAIFLGIKYSVIKDVSETDRREIVKAFKSFFNIPELPVEIR
ncbi:MAG: hypothetical protein ABIO55_14620 [Ginsengibacter sp.]